MAVDTHLACVNEDDIVKNIKRNASIKSWYELHWRMILAEMVSTTLLLLLGCMTCIPIDGFPLNSPMYGPIGFGLIVIFNIQTFGHISGAHMNPVVSMAAVIWGKLSVGLAIAYVIAQCAGAILGYGILFVLSPEGSTAGGICSTLPHARYTVIQALGIEIFLTSGLLFITCAMWDPINEEKLESTSIKIGLVVAGLSLAGGPLTGASMNPARSLGPAIWNKTWKAHWIYWVGPFFGGTLAALLYKYIWLKIPVDLIKETDELTWTEEIKEEL